jgi:thioredoxin reductase (NADPH)
MYDIIIIGSGPAGLTAAIYALRAGKSVMVLEKSAFGGQITYSPKIENYPAMGQISGNELADKMVEQVIEMGADLGLETVTGIRDGGDTKTVVTEDGEYECKSVIIAVGVKHRRLGLPNEEDFIGDGISFCAVCDGAFYKGQSVAVIGGGNSALQEAVLLSEGCTKVTMVQNLAYFTGEAKLLDILKSRDNVEFITSSVVDSIIADGGAFKGIKIKNTDSGELSDIFCDGMFVAIGLAPENDIFSDLAKLNDWGYFDSAEDCTTVTPGIYVAGDCRSKRIRQITTAAADGAVAALAACAYIDGR